MKKTIVFMCVVLLVSGSAWAKDFTLNKKAGDLTVSVSIDKNPPVVGDNNIEISLKDDIGKDVTDAQVSIDYTMPAMPGMPAMKYKTNATLSGTTYRATLQLSMAGSWNVIVKINRQGNTVSAKFSVDAR